MNFKVFLILFYGLITLTLVCGWHLMRLATVGG